MSSQNNSSRVAALGSQHRPQLLARRIKFKESAKHSSNASHSNSQGSTASASSGKAQGPQSQSQTLRSFDVFPKENLKVNWPEALPAGPGLINLGNTCFLNSTLQCLAYTPPLALYLLSRAHSSKCRQTSYCTFCEIEKHVVRVFSNVRDNRAICPKNIVGRLKTIAKHLRVGRQEDSHEFLRYLVDSLQNACLVGYEKLDHKQKESTVIHQIFGGYLQSCVQCTVCKHPSTTLETALDISLEIRNANTIEKALALFTKSELLTKDNRYRCSKCTKLVDAQKRLSILEPPTALVLHLKRFDFTFSNHGSKINKPIKYPQILDIAPYMSKPKGKHTYRLTGLVVHAGHTCNSGHYYSYVQGANNIWYCMNDSEVRQVSLDAVLNQSAYILFYTAESTKGKMDTPVSIPPKVKVQESVKKSDQTKSTENFSAKSKMIPEKTSPVKSSTLPTAIPIASSSSQSTSKPPKVIDSIESLSKKLFTSSENAKAPAKEEVSTPAPVTASTELRTKITPQSQADTKPSSKKKPEPEIIVHSTTSNWKVSRKTGSVESSELPTSSTANGWKVFKADSGNTSSSHFVKKTAFNSAEMMNEIKSWDDSDPTIQAAEQRREEIAYEARMHQKIKRPSLSELEYDTGRKKKRKLKHGEQGGNNKRGFGGHADKFVKQHGYGGGPGRGNGNGKGGKYFGSR